MPKTHHQLFMSTPNKSLEHQYEMLMTIYSGDANVLREGSFLTIKKFLSKGNNITLINHVHSKLDYNLMELALMYNLIDHQDTLYAMGARIREHKCAFLSKLSDTHFAYDNVKQALALEEKELRSDHFKVDQCYAIKSHYYEACQYVFQLTHMALDLESHNEFFFSVFSVDKNRGLSLIAYEHELPPLITIKMMLQGSVGTPKEAPFELQFCELLNGDCGLRLVIEPKQHMRFRHAFSACTPKRFYSLSDDDCAYASNINATMFSF